MSSVKKNYFYNVIYQLLLIVLPLLTAPYISRKLGVTNVGIYSYTYSIAYNFLLLAMLGTNVYGSRSIAAVRENKQLISKVFWSIYLIQFISCLLAILCFSGYTIIFVTDNKIIMWIQLIYVCSSILDISWLYFGVENFKYTVTRNIIIKLLTVLLIFIFVKSQKDLWIYTLILSTGSLLSQLYLWFGVKKYITYYPLKISDTFLHIKPVFTLFVPVIAYSIYKVIGKIILGNIAGYVEVGYYDSALKIINIPMGLITALGTVMMPRMTSIIAAGNTKKEKYYVVESVKVVTIISSASAFGIMAVSNVLPTVFYGEQYAPSGQLMFGLAISVFFTAWASVVRTQYLIPHKKDYIYLVSGGVGAIFSLLINILLIPKMAAMGAVIGTIISEFLVLFVQVFYVRKELGIQSFTKAILPYVIIGLIMFIPVYILGVIFETNIMTLIIQIFTGGVIYISLLIIYSFIIKDEIYNQIILFLRKIKSY